MISFIDLSCKVIKALVSCRKFFRFLLSVYKYQFTLLHYFQNTVADTQPTSKILQREMKKRLCIHFLWSLNISSQRAQITEPMHTQAGEQCTVMMFGKNVDVRCQTTYLTRKQNKI